MKKRTPLLLAVCSALLLGGCVAATDSSSDSSGSPDTSGTTTISDTSGGTGVASSTSEEQQDALIEIEINLETAEDAIEFQDGIDGYKVGDTVRFKVAKDGYGVVSIEANNIRLEAESGDYPYSFVALTTNLVIVEVNSNLVSKPFNTYVELSSGTGQGRVQSYNWWAENSGVDHVLAAQYTKYKISFELKSSIHLIDEDGNSINGLGYGSNDEIQINVPLYFYDGTTKAGVYAIALRIFKYGDLWVYRPLFGTNTFSQIWTGSLLFSDHRNDTQARDMVMGMSREGLKCTYTFDGPNLSARYEIGDKIYTETSTSPLVEYNGKDNGNIQFRYADLSTQASTNLPLIWKTSLNDFIVDYTQPD